MAKPHPIAVALKRKDGKTFWHRIGTAWPDDKGGFSLNFDSLPIPEYSQEYGLQCRAMIFPPKDDGPKGQAGFERATGTQLSGTDSFDPDTGDGIPF